MSKKNALKAHSRRIELETGSIETVYVQRSEQLVASMTIYLNAPHHSTQVSLSLTEAVSLMDTLSDVLDEVRGLNEVMDQRQKKRQRTRMNALRRQAGLKPLKKGAYQ